MEKIQWHQRRLNEFNEQHPYHYGEEISSRLHKKKYTCTSCGNLIPTDEVGSPSLDGEDFICDECYDGLYRFLCPVCGDFDETEECDGIGSIIILTDQEDETIIPGAYKIKKFPYVRYCKSAMENIKRVCDYAPEHLFIYDDCWTGTVKICRTCQERLAAGGG